MNLALMLTTVVNAINRAEADREPEEQVQPLRDLWEATNALVKRMEAEAMAAQAAAQQAGAVPPMGAPPAPPQLSAVPPAA
jgi:hypothetical protein